MSTHFGPISTTTFLSQILYPNPLADEVDQRRFLIEQVAGEHVQAIAMSGDLFDAPLGGADNGIIIGNLHKTPRGYPRCRR